MAHLTYYIYPGMGELAANEYHYSQAVRVGDVIECSGQGGWDRSATVAGEKISPDIKTEIEQAFLNCDETLKRAGSKGFEDVFSVKSYHTEVNDEMMEVMINCSKKFFPNHKPIWTLLGVEKLGLEQMKVEIEVRAHAPVEKAKA